MNRQIKALRFIARCLSANEDKKYVEALRSELATGELPWEQVIWLANSHLVLPSLWFSIRNKKIDELLPDDVREYCKELYVLNKRRNEKIRKQLVEAVIALNKVKIVPVLLKGGKHLVENDYGDIGARIISDIDLLVPEQDARLCLEILNQQGYREVENPGLDYGGHHHYAPMKRPNEIAVFEVHRRILAKNSEMLPVEKALSEARVIKREWGEVKVLSERHRLLHNILHSQIDDKAYFRGLVPVRSIYEAIVELKNGRSVEPWGWVQAKMEQYGQERIYQSYVSMAKQGFGMGLPNGDGEGWFECFVYRRYCEAQLVFPWLALLMKKFERLQKRAVLGV